MKRKVFFILIMLFLITSITFFVSCDKETSSSNNDNNQPQHSHIYDEWTTIKQPSCTEEGAKERVCTCGQKEIQSISKVDHNLISSTYEATCLIGGSTVTTCSNCDYIDRKTIDPVGHNYEVSVIPSCTISAEYTCTRCNAIKFDPITNTTDHENLAQGETCSKCGFFCHVRTDDGVALLFKSGMYYLEYYGEILPTRFPLSGTNFKAIYISNNVTKGENDDTASEDKAFEYVGHRDVTTVIFEKNSKFKKIASHTFSYFSSLRRINIPESIEIIDNFAFSGCDALKHVFISDISKWCSISFGYTDYSYPHDESTPLHSGATLYLNGQILTNLIIPDGITTIPDCAFSGCISINNVIIPDSVTEVGRLALACPNLVSITIGKNVQTLYGDSFDGFAFVPDVAEVINKSSLIFVQGGAGHFSTSKIIHTEKSKIEYVDNFAFLTCNNVNYLLRYSGTDTELILPAHYKNQPYEIAPAAFYGNPFIFRVVIPNGVTAIGDYAFHECPNLTMLSISDSVTTIGDHAFQFSENLTKVMLGIGVTHIGKNAFEHSTSTINYRGAESDWAAITKVANAVRYILVRCDYKGDY